jgi:hypothetical protein
MRGSYWIGYKKLGVWAFRSARSSRAIWAFVAGFAFSLLPLMQMKLACVASIHICEQGIFDRAVLESVDPQVLLALGVGSVDFTAIALFFVSTGWFRRHVRAINFKFIEYVRDTGMTIAGAVAGYAIYDYRITFVHPNLMEVLVGYAVFMFGLLLIGLSPMMLKIKHRWDRILGASGAVALFISTPYLVAALMRHVPSG